LFGHSRLRRMMLTGLRVYGPELYRLGVVEECTTHENLMEVAMGLAREIASKSPDAMRAAKRLLNGAVASDAATGLMAESVEQQKLIGSPNQLEAIMSNLQKRAANYKD
ncbi:MAG: enoyl-CoA hydratase-related protein, partial [Alphaproteobacteria bacterium]|nr:enoyl-CoA hydratase-related protein [Alphaproteobacteria bacterium]